MHGDESVSQSNAVVLAWKRLGQLYQKTLDDFTPHTTARWVVAGFLVFIFLCRVFIAQVSQNENVFILLYASLKKKFSAFRGGT